eukprot:14269855-Ditylum_brightwellii.AAC.1
MKNRWLLHRDNDAVWLTKDGHTMRFDIRIETKEGIIFAAYMKRVPTGEVANAGADAAVMRVNVNRAHELLGHTNKDRTWRTAKYFGWEVTRRGFKLCESCAVGKTKQKNMPKISGHEKAKSPGERIFLDIAT